VAVALIHMKLAVMRRDISGPRSSWVFGGAVIGLALAVGTIVMATVEATRQSTVMDLLAVTFGVWTLGWMLGPAYSGQPVLRGEQFQLQPIPRRRLALGLLGAAFVSITAPVTFLAFGALVAFGIRLGTGPVVVAVIALLLQIVFVVLLSRLTARLFAALSRSRVGGAVSALLSAVLLVASSSCWIVFVAIHALLVTGFSHGVSLTVRALPSSWGVVAVEAASRSDWTLTVLPLAGLAALVAVLWVAWNRSLGPARWARPAVRGCEAERAVPAGKLSQGATAAVFLKEMRTWSRDPQRMQSFVVSPAFAVLTCLVPLAFDSTEFFPFLGAITALMGAVTSANLYGQDGTALWLTLLMPGTEKADVRGRQLAWLTVFGPMTLVLTIVGLAVGGHQELWPWALAATVALLGGGAGLVPLVAASQLAPGPDPREIKNTPLDRSDVTGQAFVMMFLALGTAAPAVLTVLAGHLLHNDVLRQAGFVAGMATGLVAYAILGRTAHRTLARRGPDLLYLMRSGKEQRTTAGEGASFLQAMPAHRRRLFWSSFFVGCIALFPQALVPLLMKMSGKVAKVWFLALYMPHAWQWPVIVLMFALGLVSFGLAARIGLSEMRAARA
jgi:ABC-2 type transport system permease protein